MAHLIRDSFDFYGATSEAAGLWDGFGTALLSANTRFVVGQSCAPTTTLNQVGFIKTFTGNSSTVFLSFAWGMSTALGATNRFQEFRFYDSATIQCSLVFDNDGTVSLRLGDNGAVIAGPFTCFSGSASIAWTHLQFKIVFSNTVGEFHMRRNGNTVDDATATGLDNCSNANEFINKIDTKCLQSASSQIYIDDFWMFNNTVVAGEPSDWLGDIRAVQIMPNSDSVVAFSRSAGATNFSNVDELISASADYVFSSAAGTVDQYGNAGFAIAPSSILGLAIREIGLKTDAGVRTAGIRIKSGATTVDSAGVAIGTTAQSVVMNADVDPNTGVAWTAANVAALLFGPRVVT